MSEGRPAALKSLPDIVLNSIFGGFLKNKQDTQNGQANHCPENEKNLGVKPEGKLERYGLHLSYPVGPDS